MDRMHSELAALTGSDSAGAAAQHDSAAAAAAAANAAKAAAEDEWLTKSGRRLTKRQQLRGDSDTAISALMRGTYVRWGLAAGRHGRRLQHNRCTFSIGLPACGRFRGWGLDWLVGRSYVAAGRP